jgi:hypothetical protein
VSLCRLIVTATRRGTSSRGGQANPSYFRRCIRCVVHQTSNLVRGMRDGLHWSLMGAARASASGRSRERRLFVDRSSEWATRVGLAGNSEKSTCEMGRVRAVTRARGLRRSPRSFQLLLSERSAAISAGRRSRQDFRPIRGASTATGALREAVHAQQFGFRKQNPLSDDPAPAGCPE